MPQPPNEGRLPTAESELTSLEQRLHASLDKIEARNSLEIQHCQILIAELKRHQSMNCSRKPDFQIRSERKAA